MEWLLILSAMLSAVTGAFSGVRDGAEARLDRMEAATALAIAVPVAEQAARRAETAIPEPEPTAGDVPMPRDLALPASVPLYADRLIE